MSQWRSNLLSMVLLSSLCSMTMAAEPTEPPILKYTEPTEGSRIAEDGVFALLFDQAVKPESLLEHTSCLVSGVGERIPVRLLTEDERQQLFKAPALSWIVESADESNDSPAIKSGDAPLRGSEKIAFVQCTRQLPTDAKVTLAITSGLEGVNHKATVQAWALDYQVREPFKLTFSCERINPKANCSPLGHVSLLFSSQVPKDQAQKVQLMIDGKEVQASDEILEEGSFVSYKYFQGPFPPKASIEVRVPDNFVDDMGRPLVNADKFPFKATFDNYPPLLKFATGDFGIIESYAHAQPGVSLKKQPALIPLTVRNVEKKLATRGLYQAGHVSELATQDDAQVRKWLEIIPRLNYRPISQENFTRLLQGEEEQYQEGNLDSRNLSVLATQKGARQYDLPSLKNVNNETEVIGLPVKAPGFYVFEARSPLLGEQLTKNAQPMYVRTTALVTNMAVHLKTSEDGALVWVTRLDDAQVIPNAKVRLSACDNREIATGETDDKGVFRFEGKLPKPENCDYDTYMASARIGPTHPMAYGVADYAFAFSTWNNGIEDWQFNVGNVYRSYYSEESPQLLIHPVLGRTLLRAGETVHMKHFARLQTKEGIAAPMVDTRLPNKVVFNIEALDEEIELPLKWERAPNGGVYAETDWHIPQTAKNGVYSVKYREGDKDFDIVNPKTSFQVETFKVPFLKGSIQATSDVQQGNILINPKTITATLQLNYIAGGVAAELPVELSAMIVSNGITVKEDNTVFGDAAPIEPGRNVFLNKKKIALDANGHAQVVIDNVPTIKGNSDIIIEASFMDPNGQVQTITQTVPVVASSILVGIRGENQAEAGKSYTAEVIAVDALGHPKPDAEVLLQTAKEQTKVVRKRLVGGFYTFDVNTEKGELTTLCQGKTDAQGILKCTLDKAPDSDITLFAHAQDEHGNHYSSRRSLWIYKGQSWDAGNDTDRVDVVPDKPLYQAGDEAVFDVKIPFREATALVSIERENVMDYQVVHFEKNSSTFKLKIKPEWAPNVFVNVLSIRGRIRGDTNDAGVAWVKDDTQAQGASTLIDLAKPSFRMGVVKVKVDNPDNHMNIDLSLDKSVYQVREKAKLHISAKRMNGDKVAQANVAVFVVDKALLELAKNNTSDILAAMWPERPWLVNTATAQGEVVGRRHYGRKAVPAGGGGGLSPTRELFDTLVFWKANVVLDNNGETDLEIPLNDSISQFEIVAVADDGKAVFGTQKVDFASKQDLQIISGLPLLIRDTDKFDAVVTLHNSTDKDMSVLVTGTVKKDGVEVLSLPEKQVMLYAGRSNRAVWQVDPLHLSDNEGKQILDWYFDAKEVKSMDEEVSTLSSDATHKPSVDAATVSATPTTMAVKLAQDKIHVTQQLIPYVPVTVRQSQLLQVAANAQGVQLSVQPPTRALSVNDAIRGGIQVQIQKSLGASLNTVKRYFAEYPYSCFEQRASVAMGLQNHAAWDALMQEANSYLDEQGLIRYYPSAAVDGSPLLNAYILSIAADAKTLGWSFDIPEAIQERMLTGLSNFVLGKLNSEYDWIPVADKKDYYLTLLAALARYHRVTESMLEAYPLDAGYDEAGLVNLYIIHQSLHGEKQHDVLVALRERILAKMANQAEHLVFKNMTALDNLWWLMDDSKSIQAKLLIAVARDDMWKKEVPALAQGLIAAQVKGQWGMTTNNLLGSLAVHAFTQAFEKVPAEGEVNVSLSDQDHDAAQEWNGLSLNQAITIPWVNKKSADMKLSLVGKGAVWATVTSLAAVEPIENTFAGYRVDKLIEPVSRRVAGQWSVGDVYRVHLRITADAPMSWVVVNDPIPSGATVLGSGLGRDSILSGQLDEKLAEHNDEYSTYVEPSFVERKSDVYRAYYRFMDKGEINLEYTVRLNNVGKFSLPATRVEAMYAPSLFGEAVNNDIQVKAP
ncbi:alpha-2-macroglobulin family protein [Pelistega europaea]|uniref:Alpha-2-macroglobulin n=1 Tax=Pelistega europaea TaxID=106147 RepID=A0A7Y4LBK5_9BURK|nr:MG2 domain-containing protein [Pelistega europaea]NOL50499.1 hypothetical protein [Pelistega europaea]